MSPEETPVPCEIRGPRDTALAYSFCTMVTDLPEYRAMLGAFSAEGFTSADCEFLFIDNSDSNSFDAYRSYNLFLQEAKGRYIVLCHQDILPNGDDRQKLDLLLAELNQRDPHWGLCGNAGATAKGASAIRITDPNEANMSYGGPFPARVISLDENFIVVRREANLATSGDLSGYHWYGSDLCIIADTLGWNAYVIDFHLLHKSGGNPGADFTAAGAALSRKYARAFRSRCQHVITQRPVFISGSRAETACWRGLWRVRSLLKRVRNRLRRLAV